MAPENCIQGASKKRPEVRLALNVLRCTICGEGRSGGLSLFQNDRASPPLVLRCSIMPQRFPSQRREPIRDRFGDALPIFVKYRWRKLGRGETNILKSLTKREVENLSAGIQELDL